eukprot:jgi/Mesvir1/17674/Mv06213-RA.1
MSSIPSNITRAEWRVTTRGSTAEGDVSKLPSTQGSQTADVVPLSALLRPDGRPVDVSLHLDLGIEEVRLANTVFAYNFGGEIFQGTLSVQRQSGLAQGRWRTAHTLVLSFGDIVGNAVEKGVWDTEVDNLIGGQAYTALVGTIPGSALVFRGQQLSSNWVLTTRLMAYVGTSEFVQSASLETIEGAPPSFKLVIRTSKMAKVLSTPQVTFTGDARDGTDLFDTPSGWQSSRDRTEHWLSLVYKSTLDFDPRDDYINLSLTRSQTGNMFKVGGVDHPLVNWTVSIPPERPSVEKVDLVDMEGEELDSRLPGQFRIRLHMSRSALGFAADDLRVRYVRINTGKSMDLTLDSESIRYDEARKTFSVLAEREWPDENEPAVLVISVRSGGVWHDQGTENDSNNYIQIKTRFVGAVPPGVMS